MKDLKLKFWRFFKDKWPYIIIIFLVFTFFWKVFLQNKVPLPADMIVGVYYPWLDYKWEGFPAGVPVKNPITSDVVSFSYPMRELAIELLKKGEWALWNPYILTGTPLLANFQSAPFMITNLFYFILKTVDAWTLQIISQHLLAVLFTYLLLRNWKVSKLGSTLGGIIFSFSGFNIMWSEWNSHVLTASYIPLLILLIDKYIKDGKVLYGIGFSVALSFQIFSGYPQVVLYTFIALGIFIIFKLFEKKLTFRKLFFLGVFGILGLGLSTPQILPGAELLSMSQRSAESIPYIWAYLPWVKIITFIAPDYFGNHATGNWWGPQDYTSNTGYIGVVAAVLSIVALQTFRKNKETKYVLALALISLLIALPLPISKLLWNSNLLGLKAASAHRALVLWNFAISLLSAIGFDYLLSNKKAKVKLALLIPSLLIAGFGLSALYMYAKNYGNPLSLFSDGTSKYTVALRNLIFPGGILIISSILLILRNTFKQFRKNILLLLFIVTVFELFRFGWKYLPFSTRNIIYPSTPVLEYLQGQIKQTRVTGLSVIPMNMRMHYKLESPEGYDAVYPVYISRFLAVLSSGNSKATFAGRYGFVDKEDSHLLDLINTKYYIALKKDDKGKPSPTGDLPQIYKNQKFTKVFEDRSVVILSSESANDRAFIVYDWEVVEDDDKALELLLDKSFPISSKIILSKNPPFEKNNKDLNPTVTYQEYNEQSSIIDVTTSENGMLFVSDAYYPGWRAYIDGSETEIFRANYAFRAVAIPKGIHEVIFDYHPDSFFKGVKFAAISGLILCIIGILIGKRWDERYT